MLVIEVKISSNHIISKNSTKREYYFRLVYERLQIVEQTSDYDDNDNENDKPLGRVGIFLFMTFFSLT